VASEWGVLKGKHRKTTKKSSPGEARGKARKMLPATVPLKKAGKGKEQNFVKGRKIWPCSLSM